MSISININTYFLFQCSIVKLGWVHCQWIHLVLEKENNACKCGSSLIGTVCSVCECSLHTLLESFIQSDWRRDTAWIVDGEVTPLSLQRPPLQYIIILPCLSVNAS